MSMITIELQPLRTPRGGAWPGDEPPSSRPTPEIYARRRAGVALAVLVALTSAVFGLRSWSGPTDGTPASAVDRVPAAASAAAAPAVASSHLVQPGDTLWSIAQARVGDGDVARYVAALVDLNGDAPLQVGQVLVLPS